jgi:hypothetical protein
MSSVDALLSWLDEAINDSELALQLQQSSLQRLNAELDEAQLRHRTTPTSL